MLPVIIHHRYHDHPNTRDGSARDDRAVSRVRCPVSVLKVQPLCLLSSLNDNDDDADDDYDDDNDADDDAGGSPSG